MASETGRTVDEPTARDDYSTPKLVVIAGITAVLFAGGLLVTERLPELLVDVDFKPFFIVYAIVALLPWGMPSLSAGLGAAIGEGFLDVLEGYEVDDPFGFVGYVIGFAVAGWIFDDEPQNTVRLAAGAILGALIQAMFEATALVVIEGEALEVAAISAAGNTVTHGILLGVIPLVPTIAALHGRIERFLGFAPQGDAA